jgi:hypothetical protein
LTRPVFKDSTLRETSGSHKLLIRKYNCKSSIERGKIRRSAMRRRSWQQHKKKHLPSNNVKDVIERGTLRSIVGNCTLRNNPNIFQKKEEESIDISGC